MKPFLERLPDNKTRDIFLELFLDRVETRNIGSKKCQVLWSLDYVRLNIIADKP
jgi:hypothetical protein